MISRGMSERMSTMEVKKQIHDFVLENLALGKGVTRVADEDSLIESGIVDSLGIFSLVTFLENTFGIRIGDEEIVQENFRTIDTIELLVKKKLRRSEPSA